MAEKIVKDSHGLVKDLANDCISRQAAIDVINESNSPIAEYLIGEIMALPSAQEKRTDKRTEMHTCDLIDRQPSSSCSHEKDTISRQAAIDALGKDPGFKVRLFGKSYDEGRSDQWFRDVYKLTTLPPEQPERKKGKWIYGEDEYGIDGYHCDKCGFFVPWDYAHKFINYIEDYNFCPNCGADMRGEQDG